MTTIRHETNCLDAVALLDRATFAPTELMTGEDVDRCEWWVVRNEHGNPIAFAGARPVDAGGAVYLARAGVVQASRGHGLQRKLIAARVRWARRQGAAVALTYTLVSNHASSNSLMAAGFRLYDPAYAWAGVDGVLYWRLELSE